MLYLSLVTYPPYTSLLILRGILTNVDGDYSDPGRIQLSYEEIQPWLNREYLLTQHY